MTSPDLLGLPAPPLGGLKWKKVLFYLAETAITGSEHLAYNYGMQMRALPTFEGDQAADEWRRFQVVFDNNRSVVNADMAVFTVDVVNYTNGAIDSSWTQTDHTQVHDQLFGFVQAIGVHINNRYTCTRIRAYRMIFNPYPNPMPPTMEGDDPFANSGPPTFDVAHTTAMTGGNTSADVICTTITEETPLRAHWGRFYTPPIGSALVDANGRLFAANIDSIAAAWNNCLTSLAALDFYTVVPTTQQNKKRVRTLQNVTGIHVDDVPDVIRRRRPKYVGYRRRYDEAFPAGLSMGTNLPLEDTAPDT